MRNNVGSFLARYGCAVLSIALATVARLLFDPALSSRATFASMVFAILLTAWYGGFRPALVAVFLGAIASIFFLIPPRDNFALAGFDQRVTMVLYLSTSLGVALLGGAMHSGWRLADSRAHAALAHASLIDRAHEALLAYDAVLVWEWNGPITFWNSGAERLYLFSRAEALGRVSHELLRTGSSNDLAACFGSLERTGFWEGKLEDTTRDGRQITVEARMLLVRNAEGPYVLQTNRDITASRKAEEALLVANKQIEERVRVRTVELEEANGKLRVAEDRLRMLIEGVKDHAIYMLDAKGHIVTWNSGSERVLGYLADEIIGAHCSCLFAANDIAAGEPGRELLLAATEGNVEFEGWRVCKKGQRIWVSGTLAALHDDSGTLTGFAQITRDLTESRRKEDQTRQSHKMETIGLLAGGIAHDFNNLLTIISGYSSIVLAKLSTSDPTHELVKAIGEAGERAASLTEQLLAFSRQSMLEPKVLDMNHVVRETEKMLRRLIGEDILLTAVLDLTISRVKVDPGQLAQMLMNMALNARDAMPKGGKLTIETANVELDESYRSTHPEVLVGSYVMLAVSDNGQGMSPEVKIRVFEPFFTTKYVGRGTGLGLAVVHGIAKQSGGHVTVYSEPGRGTTFKIYLPVVDEQLSITRKSDSGEGMSGTETVLFVEDEDSVRVLANLILRSHGYHVLEAKDGQDALRVADNHQGQIDILMTDVVMPNMDGRELAEALRPRYPRMKVSYMSGYTDDAVVRHGILQGEVAFLQKPFTAYALVKKIRQVLEQPAESLWCRPTPKQDA